MLIHSLSLSFTCSDRAVGLLVGRHQWTEFRHTFAVEAEDNDGLVDCSEVHFEGQHSTVEYLYSKNLT